MRRGFRISVNYWKKWRNRGQKCLVVLEGDGAVSNGAQAIRRCSLCNGAITTTFWFCSNCETTLGIDSLPASEWGPRVRELAAAHQAQRRRERAILAHEVDAPGLVDRLLYGDFNDDPTGSDPFNYEDEPSRPMGRLRCCACRNIYSDIWPTFPRQVREWHEPVCPACGRTHYEDA